MHWVFLIFKITINIFTKTNNNKLVLLQKELGAKDETVEADVSSTTALAEEISSTGKRSSVISWYS